MIKSTNSPNPLLRGGPDQKHYDRDNTTTTPLGIGATYTGTASQNTISHVKCIVITDQAGKLYIDFSDDKTNWVPHNANGQTVAANNETEVIAYKGSRYCRVRFVNDSGVAQTFLRLHTYYDDLDVPTRKANAASGFAITLTYDGDGNVDTIQTLDKNFDFSYTGSNLTSITVV